MTPTFPDWASRYVGIPFVPHGETHDGVDCWGLLSLVYWEVFKRPLPPYPGIRWNVGQDEGPIADGARQYMTQFEPVELGREQVGDGVMLRMAGLPVHVGLVVAPGWMLHASIGAASVIESFQRSTWKKRVLGIYRYRAQ